ncbi:zinc finger protein 43-like [Lucilia sericata]|uniref:zinc finger protein 43-like n=1 Tax=Lucilia sericata TaxID=13632 RepID=UPI0018A7E844|nr:zinc finger protein 43-like [Lucilia sericata]
MESAISPSFNCELCHKNFVQKSSLNRHVREQHLQPGLYQCKQCGLRFSKKYNLQMHIKNIHTKTLQKTNKYFKSSDGKREFTNLSNLKAHNKESYNNIELIKSSNPQEEDVLEPDAQTLAATVLKELKELQKDIQPIEAAEENLTTATDFGIRNIVVKDNLYPSGQFKQLKVQSIKRFDGFSYLICEFCKKEFKKLYNFLRHLRTHTKIRPFICVLCKKSFPTTAQLKTHCSIHRLHESFGLIRKFYQCPKCKEGFSARQQFDKHLSSSLTCSQLTFKCPHCGKTFKTLKTLINHKHGEKDNEIDLLKKILPIPEPVSGEYDCNLCGLTLSSQIVLKQHENRHANLFKHQCLECQQTYATQAALRIHTKTHLKYTSFKCLYCSKTFKTKQNCRQHMITHLKMLINTKEQKENLLKYPIFIGNEQTQNEQMCIIKKQKSKISQIEPKLFNAKVEFKYKCSKCDKTFRYNAWLKKHFNYKHSKEKPYECETCRHKFRSKQSLDNHQLVHATQRVKHTCQVCGRLYASNKSLKLHLRIHTQEKPFKCNKCSKQFRTSGHFIQHCKSNHKE